ncbi:MAG: peptidoglycan-binding domain-containing protein [Alphaproteobacteria bacterium]|nr:peptidoglycan-binding domain-containing protein [Alphaproteobacteria bacterium]
MRTFPILTTALLIGLAACASNGSNGDSTMAGSADNGTDSDKNVHTETMGSTTVTIDTAGNENVEIVHNHHYVSPYYGRMPHQGPPQVVQPRNNYHTHTGPAQPVAAVQAPPPPPPQVVAPRPIPYYRHQQSYPTHQGGYPPVMAQPKMVAAYPATPPHMMHRRAPQMSFDNHHRVPMPTRDTTGIGRSEVAEAQATLAQLGFNPGRIDGIYGPQTRRAVIAYTTHQGMPTDGAITHSLIAYLRSDLNERIAPNSTVDRRRTY